MLSTFLRQMDVAGFRNLSPTRLTFDSPLCIIYGDNAQGKTNLLEAIYVLTALRSFRTSKNRDLIQLGEESGRLGGQIASGAGERDVEVFIYDRSRRILVDGKAIRSVARFGEEVKVVLFTPEDMHIVRGAPALRRNYLDGAISHLFPQYCEYLRNYRQAVLQKNRLLSQGSVLDSVLDVWNEKQVEYGSKLIVTRARFVNHIRGLFQESFEEISGGKVSVDLRYIRSIPALADLEGAALRREFLLAVKGVVAEERRLKRALLGPHRDDLALTLDGQEAAAFGSQGQMRMLALCFKIVELKVILEERGMAPIFLLDDVSSELDRRRNSFLMEYLARSGCQVFITTTSLDHVPVQAFSDVAKLSMVSGKVHADAFA